MRSEDTPGGRGDYNGPVYGVCPNGHGDEHGLIAQDESQDRLSAGRCPICEARLEYVDACEDNHPWCVGPDGPSVDGEAWGGKCSTCSLAEVSE